MNVHQWQDLDKLAHHGRRSAVVAARDTLLEYRAALKNLIAAWDAFMAGDITLDSQAGNDLYNRVSEARAFLRTDHVGGRSPTEVDGEEETP